MILKIESKKALLRRGKRVERGLDDDRRRGNHHEDDNEQQQDDGVARTRTTKTCTKEAQGRRSRHDCQLDENLRRF